MYLLAALLHVCLLTAFMMSTRIQEHRLQLRSYYPEEANYSYVTLKCSAGGASGDDTIFLWNNRSTVQDVVASHNVLRFGNGSLNFLLTQQTEAYFACVSNGTMSNQIPLAAQPMAIPNTSTDVHIVLNSVTGSIEHELSCKIQPGALEEKYHVEWIELKLYTNSSLSLNVSTFNMTLNVTASLNGAEYQCRVTIDHNGTEIEVYNGGIFKFVVEIQNGKGKSSHTDVAIASGVLLIALLVAFILLVFFCAKRLLRDTSTIHKNYTARLDNDVSEQNLTTSGYDSTALTSPRNGTQTESTTSSIFLRPGDGLLSDINDNDHDKDIIQTLSSLECMDDISSSPNPCAVQDTTQALVSPHFHFGPLVPQCTKRPQSLACSSRNESEKTASLSKEDSSSVETPCFVKRPTSLACVSPPEYQSAWSREGNSSDTESPQCIMGPKSQACSTACKVPTTLQCRDAEISEGSNTHSMCQELCAKKIANSTACVKKVKDPSSCVPAWMQTVCAISNCTTKGVHYRSRSYGFTLDIPEAAIPQGMSVTIDVGIGLQGPFEYPENVQCVSPILWVCVRNRENFRFIKPVKITLQHCLEVAETVSHDTLGLHFLKAGHTPDLTGCYSFSRSDDSVSPGSAPNFLTLSTDHFCYMCIVSNVSQDTTDRMQYCLSQFYPQPVVREENDRIHFYVSFFLKACLKTIADQTTGKGYKRVSPYRFSFSREHSREKCLRIRFSQPANWVLSRMCNEEIYARDIHFHQKDKEQLCFEQEQEMYPPKFTIHAGSDLVDVKSSKVHVEFFGADKTIALDVPLQIQIEGSSPRRLLTPDPYTPEHRKSLTLEVHTPSSPYKERTIEDPSPRRLLTPSSPYKERTIPLNTFMEYVAVHVRTKWRFFGIMVEIPADVLDSFPAHDCLQCFVQVFEFWVRRGSPSVSWDTIVSVLESGTVDEKTRAEQIRQTFLPASVLPHSHDRGQSTPHYLQQSKSSESGYGSTSPSMIISDV